MIALKCLERSRKFHASSYNTKIKINLRAAACRVDLIAKDTDRDSVTLHSWILNDGGYRLVRLKRRDYLMAINGSEKWPISDPRRAQAEEQEEAATFCRMTRKRTKDIARLTTIGRRPGVFISFYDLLFILPRNISL